jgi:hypothetical protein
VSPPPKGGLAILFGKKPSADEHDDGPDDGELKSAKDDAFGAFYDAIHAKNKEGARRAWNALHGEEDADEDEGGAGEYGVEGKEDDEAER